MRGSTAICRHLGKLGNDKFVRGFSSRGAAGGSSRALQSRRIPACTAAPALRATPRQRATQGQ